jgi:hypothetical protein
MLNVENSKFMKTKLLITLSLIGLLVGCAPSTQLTKSWKDPSLNSATVVPFKKVLVIARVKDETSNRIAEDKIVASMKPGVGVPSYSYLSPRDTVQKVVDAKLLNDGFDGLVLMKLTAVNKTLDYQPGTSYGGFYGYRYSSPGYLSTDQTFYVETSIYALASGKMLWSGTTSTLNPTQFDQTMSDIIMAVKNELVKEGLIKAQ